MPHSIEQILADANHQLMHEQHVHSCAHCKSERNSNFVYSLINYVAALALIALALVIYLEPVSR